MRSIGCGCLMVVEWQFVEFRVDHIRAKSLHLYTGLDVSSGKIDVDLKVLIFPTLSPITTNED
jgi:hypothetical protein